LWEALPPGGASRRRHPVDDHTRATLDLEAAALAAALPQARFRTLFPFDDPAPRVSFLRLAEEAGLGTTDTVLGLLLHPEFGPWVSLRACLLTDLDLPAGGRLLDFRPCDGCPRPCLEACPARVLNAFGWDHAACFEYRRRGPNCLDGCSPRIACPVGAAHRYGPEEMRHRQLAALG
jgi:epoxyqueuosine reductase QueG